MGGSQPCNANTVDRAVAGDMQVTSHCAVWGERERENSRLGTNIELTPGHQPAAMGKGQGAHVPARDLQTETGRAGKRMWRRLSPRGGRGAFTKGLLPPSERARTHRAFCVCFLLCDRDVREPRGVSGISSHTRTHRTGIRFSRSQEMVYFLSHIPQTPSPNVMQSWCRQNASYVQTNTKTISI
jgi:hypothetical protein